MELSEQLKEFLTEEVCSKTIIDGFIKDVVDGLYSSIQATQTSVGNAKFIEEKKNELEAIKDSLNEDQQKKLKLLINLHRFSVAAINLTLENIQKMLLLYADINLKEYGRLPTKEELETAIKTCLEKELNK